jgi:orotate phosphoribosyltransferase
VRHVLATRRTVPLDRVEEYLAAWTGVRRAALAAGLRAWLFRGTDHEDHFMEFLEWRDDVTAGGPLAGNLDELRDELNDAFGHAHEDRWSEANIGDAGLESVDADREALAQILRERSLRVGDFVLASGARSSYYIDARTTTMSGAGQHLIGRAALAALDDATWRPDAVGGLTLGADPVSYAIAHAAAASGRDLDAFTVRKQPKEHGSGRLVEGGFRTGMRVVVCEDTITTGGSALTAIEAVEEAGGKVIGVLAIVDREEGGRAHLEGRGYPVRALFTARELLDRAGREEAPED